MAQSFSDANRLSLTMPTLEGFLLNDLIDRSLLLEQDVKDLSIQSKADSMALVYQDCIFDKKVFYAKNVGIRSRIKKEAGGEF